MKKLIATAILITALVAVASVIADSRGAIKAEIRVKGNGPKVGWVIFDTTASRNLIAVVHLTKGEPNTKFWVGLRVPHEGVELEVVGELSTNNQGRGNTRIVMKLPANISDPVKAEIKLVEPVYSSPRWTEIPLKKRPVEDGHRYHLRKARIKGLHTWMAQGYIISCYEALLPSIPDDK